MRLPRATLLLLFVNLLVFRLAAGSFFASPLVSEISRFGLSPANPLSVFTYQFLHLWPAHLATNLFLLLVFGSIVEGAVGGHKTLALYLCGGVTGGVVHLFLEGGTVVSGASASVWSVVGAALVLRPILSFTSFAASLLLVPFALHPSVQWARRSWEEARGEELGAVVSREEEARGEFFRTAQEVAELMENRSSAESEAAAREDELERLEEMKKAGELSPEEYEDRAEPLEEALEEREAEIRELEARVEEEERQLNQTGEQLSRLSRLSSSLRREMELFYYSSQLEQETATAEAPHLAGLLTGYLMVILSEPLAFERWKRYFTDWCGSGP